MEQDKLELEAAIWRVYKHICGSGGSNDGIIIPNDMIAKILLEFCPTLCSRFAESDVVERLVQVQRDREQLAKLRAMPAVAQRSEEWFALRRERLTASDASKALTDNRTRDMLVRSKAFPETVRYVSSPPTEWGKMFEPMAMRIYQARNAHVDVHEFGLIPHPTLKCFGASPDGITDLGVMVEIKCPYTREIKPDYIPDYYEIQMQGQLAVCGLTDCDYIECKLIKHSTKDDYISAAKRAKHPEDHGVVVAKKQDGKSEMEYTYSPVMTSPEQVLLWAESYIGTSTGTSAGTSGGNIGGSAKLIMWTLGLAQIQRVKFDEERWAEMTPKFEQFWQDVLDARERQKKNDDFIDDDDD